MVMHKKLVADSASRRDFIGGSDARIMMGQDEKSLIRLWQEKRGEPKDQLGLVTDSLDRRCGLLLTWLPLDSLAEPDPGPTSVLFDELDAGFLKGRLDRVSMRADQSGCLLPPSRPLLSHKQPHFFTVLEDELNTGLFQCTANSLHGLLRNLSTFFFEINNSGQSQRGFFRKLRLGHVQQSAGCPTLRRSHLTNIFC
jgi:hypothetical protein